MHKITSYNQFALEVMKRSSKGLSSDEIAEQIGEIMEKEPLQLLPLIQKVIMQNTFIIVN